MSSKSFKLVISKIVDCETCPVDKSMHKHWKLINSSKSEGVGVTPVPGTVGELVGAVIPAKVPVVSTFHCAIHS
jgi:hypothetical protein